MAFSTANAATNEILKIFYEGPIRDLINSRRVLMRYVKRRKRDYHGLRVYVPVHIGRNGGTGAGSTEGGNFPAPQNQQYKHLEYTVKSNYGSMEITGLGKSASKDNIGAFAQGLQSEMMGLATDVLVNLNRQMCGNGDGVLTTTNDGTATTASMVVRSSKLLRVGMVVQIFTAGGTDKTSGGLSITAINADGVTVTLSSTTAARAADDQVVALGSRTAGAGPFAIHNEIWGIRALVNSIDPSGFGTGLTDNVGNLTRSGATYLQANVLANGGTLRPLTLDAMQQAWDKCDIEGGDEDDGADGVSNTKVPLGLILTNHALKRRYAGLLQADKRYPAGGEITLDGGYAALDFNGVPLVAEKDLTRAATTSAIGRVDPTILNEMFFLNMKAFEYFELEPGGWVDEDGSILKLKTGGSTATYADAFQAFWKTYSEFGVVEPNTCAVLQDVDESP